MRKFDQKIQLSSDPLTLKAMPPSVKEAEAMKASKVDEVPTGPALEVDFRIINRLMKQGNFSR